jgi:hypothetical protein
MAGKEMRDEERLRLGMREAIEELQRQPRDMRRDAKESYKCARDSSRERVDLRHAYVGARLAMGNVWWLSKQTDPRPDFSRRGFFYFGLVNFCAIAQKKMTASCSFVRRAHEALSRSYALRT